MEAPVAMYSSSDVVRAVESASYLIDAYRRLWKGEVVRDLAEAEAAWGSAQLYLLPVD